MTTPANPPRLASWRRIVAEHYARVRAQSGIDPAAAAAAFRAARESLFREHPDSPIAPELRKAWPGLQWFPYDPAWRVVGTVDMDVPRMTFDIPLSADGVLRCTRFARVAFTIRGVAAALALYWFEGYGGGLWLPYSDASNGGETYGGGRYLYDTIKGADLGAGETDIVLDFNFAYYPSCAYDERWSCPLSPPENKLPFVVDAGERNAVGAVKPAARATSSHPAPSA
jgi:uncharacterized protein